MTTSKKYRLIVFRKLTLWLLNILFVLVFVLSLQYLKIEIFYKEKNIPFTGDSFYNPYKSYSANTLKANFHTHSTAWYHLTNGSQKPQDIFNYYKVHGYDIISLSNYQKITRNKKDTAYIPVYEHGYNLRKSHQLVINSDRVTFFDFSLFSDFNTKQQVIKKLKQSGGLIALAHPKLRGGYRADEMEYLRGYDFIEVFNSFVTSEGIWDAALTSGYPAWILADDDCHNIYHPELIFNSWNRIGAKGRTRDNIINALKQGCSYGVMNMNHKEVNFLDSCTVKNGTIRVKFSNNADVITFVADRGSVKKEFYNRSSASYKINKEDSYVRVEARNGTQLIYLNPVIRYNGNQLSFNNEFPTVNAGLTIVARILALILSLAILIIILLVNGIIAFPIHPGRFVTDIRKKHGVSLGLNRN